MGERQGLTDEGLANEAPSKQSDAPTQPIVLKRLTLKSITFRCFKDKKEHTIECYNVPQLREGYTKFRDIHTTNYEDLEIHFKYTDESTACVASCASLDTFDESYQTIIDQFNNSNLVFENDESERVSWMHITTLYTVDGDIFSRECHANSYEDVEEFVNDYPSSEINWVDEVHTSSIAHTKRINSYMKPKIVRNLQELLGYAKTLTWRKQDNPPPQDDSSESSEYIKWTY